MAIIVECQNGHKLRAKDDAIGKKVRCPTCQSVFVLGQTPRSKGRSKVADEELLDEDDEFDFEEDEPPRSAKRTPAKPQRSASRGKAAKKPSRGSSLNYPLIIGGGLLGAVVLAGGIYFLTHRSSHAGDGEPVAQADNSQPAPATPKSDPAPAPVAKSEPTPAPAAVAPVGLTSPEPKEAASPAVTPADATATPDANAAAGKPAAVPDETPAETVAATGMHVWDTGESAEAAAVPRTHGAVPKTWTAVAPATIATYKFLGDCMIDNEKLWLHIPHSASGVLSVASRERGAAVVPISIEGGAKSEGPRAVSVTELTADSATVAIGAEGSAPAFACRLVKGKYWVEVAPKEGAERLNMGVNSRFVVVPTEFGEDAILDATLTGGKSSIAIPHENMVLAMQADGKYVAVLTYPSIEQAGEAKFGAASAPSDKDKAAGGRVNNISAKFAGRSVFVGMIPEKETWYSEEVSKVYSAAGQYAIEFKPKQAGIWRMAGRVKGKYFVSDVPSEHFVFACSQSGTMECLFAYLSRSPDDAKTSVVTPMSIYRETLEANKDDAYLLETEAGGSLDRRTTKYRDVCNSIDDMKDVWRSKPEMLKSKPDYVPSLLADCRSIINRMDQRLHEYETLTERLGEMHDALGPKDTDKSDAALQAFAATVRKTHSQLKSVKIVSTNSADKMAAEIEQKLGGRLNPNELDTLAERFRDVANDQEEQLKKLRAMVLQLSEVCGKQRETAQDSWKEQLTLVGRHCRKVLRTRDPEE